MDQATTQRQRWRLDHRDYAALAMLALAVVGVGYTDLDPSGARIYWQWLAPVFGVVCVASTWRRRTADSAKTFSWNSVITQALHWAATAVAMQLIFLPRVKDIFNDDALGLAVLIVLSLGAFLAGVHLQSWRICAVGAFLALAIPAFSFFAQAALLMVALGVGIAALIAVTLWFKSRTRQSASEAI